MFTLPFLCCKVWPIVPGYGISSCGECGEKPRLMTERAAELATAAHDGQLDKLGRPYIEHPSRVADRVAPDAYAETVAWLHDVVEDTEVRLIDLLEMGYPDRVVEAVDAISKRDHESLEDYLIRVASNDLAYTVKLADVADNSSEDRLSQLDPATASRLRAKHARSLAILASLR